MLTNALAAAGRNEISVNSVKDSNLTMDEELRDQLTVDGYKKQYGNVQTLAVLFISVTHIPDILFIEVGVKPQACIDSSHIYKATFQAG